MAKRRIRSKKHSSRRRQARKKRAIFYAIATLVFIGLFIGLTHLSALEIKTITVDTDASHLQTEQIEVLAEGVMSERLWLLLRRDNILLLPRKELRREIKEVSRRVKSVDVDVRGLRSVRLQVQNRVPVAVVCSQTATSTSSCQLVDKNSYVFAQANTASTTMPLRLTSSREISLGDRLLSTEQFRILEEFIDKISDLGFTTEKVALKRFDDAYIKTSNSSDEAEGVEIRVNLEDDLEEMFRNLETVVRNKSFVSLNAAGEEVSTSPFAFEYIDLRFDNKVFYR